MDFEIAGMEETEEMKVYSAGWDFGNTDSGLVVNVKGQQLKLVVPTAFCRVDTHVLQNLGIEGAAPEKEKGDKEKEKIDTSSIVLQMQGESVAFAFGDFALSQKGETWNGRYDQHRYASKYSLRGLLAMAALLVPDKEFGLYVVGGLPADYYVKYPELRQEIKEGLDGKWTFTLDGRVWRTIHLEISTIVMEGAGALIGYPGLTKFSECAVADIGGGTTDLYAQLGAAPIQEFCKGLATAVEAATSLVKQAFQSKHKRALTDREARDIMRAYVESKNAAAGKNSSKKKHPNPNHPYPLISAFGTPVTFSELEAMVEAAVDDIAGDIASFISATWKDAIGRFDPILLIGGGAYYFFEAIRKRIAHIKMHDDPVFANPVGYATLATRRLAKKNQEEAKARAAANSATES